MTTGELKQEAIKKAYGEYYNDLKMVIEHTHGWCKQNLKKYFGEENIQSKVKKDSLIYRPLSLSGLENNNQWVRIEEDGSNLPDEEGCYFVHSKVWWKPFYRIDIFTGRLRNSISNNKTIFTHYQTIIKPEPPLY